MPLPALLCGCMLPLTLLLLLDDHLAAADNSVGVVRAGVDPGAARSSGVNRSLLLQRRLSACPAGPWEAGCPTAPGCLVNRGGVCTCQELTSRVIHYMRRAESHCVYTSHIGKWADDCFFCGEGFWAKEPLTTFDLAHGRMWEALGKATGNACRGDNETDNSALDYELHANVMTLESCKALCLKNLPRCKGIEYGPSGHCELRTRQHGIHATVPSSSSYSCHRFGWPVLQLQPADGGIGRACRGEAPSDNDPSYYDLTLGAAHLEDCQARCAAAPVCFGLEFGIGGRCEIWTQPVRATEAVHGYTCLRFDPDSLPLVVTTTTTTTVSRTPGEWVIFGPCGLDAEDAACITSPNYPGMYGRWESCTMHLYGDPVKYLDIEAFVTAHSGDRLRFSDSGPHLGFWGRSDYLRSRMLGWHITGTIEWSTDGDERVASGWKLCARDIPPTTTTDTFTTTTSTTAVIGEWVISGPCPIVQGQSECVTSPNYPSNYGNREGCLMSIWGGAQHITKYLWIEDFSTEAGSDWLRFGGTGASGVNCQFHGWEIGGRSLSWNSDSSGVARGWKICARDVPPPTSTITSTTGAPGTWMTPSSRSCNLDPEDAACVMNKGQYYNMERCELELWGDVPRYLEVQSFQTQYGHDFLTVNGVQYSGDVGPPQGVLIQGPISWSSDGTIRAQGWKICAREQPPSTTTSTSLVPGTWRIQSSWIRACVLDPEDAACVTSARFPSGFYYNGDMCALSLWGDVPRYLDVQFFQTQRGGDVLTVNGQRYSGASRPPQGVLINGVILWETDNSRRYRGWKICARESMADVSHSQSAPGPVSATPIFP